MKKFTKMTEIRHTTDNRSSVLPEGDVYQFCKIIIGSSAASEAKMKLALTGLHFEKYGFDVDRFIDELFEKLEIKDV